MLKLGLYFLISNCFDPFIFVKSGAVLLFYECNISLTITLLSFYCVKFLFGFKWQHG